MKRINALTIAGTDPSGGAGIQADLKTFSALGAYGTSVITALVAQNTRGVQSVYEIEPQFVGAQLASVLTDVRIDSAKIGMLANADIVAQVAQALDLYPIPFVVLDTVMVAKSATSEYYTADKISGRLAVTTKSSVYCQCVSCNCQCVFSCGISHLRISC